MPVTLVLADGSRRELPDGARAVDHVPEGGEQRPLAVRVDGRVVGLDEPLYGVEARVLTWADPEGRTVYRHTSAHILAQAVKRLFPEARLATGPALEDGFFYDIELPRRLGEEELAAVEAEMERILREDLPIRREVVSREEAVRRFRERGEVYKLAIIEDLPPDATLTVYRQGEFEDLCRGPHLPSTGYVGVVKVLHVAGAYWRGDERNPMLQRFYGTSFPRREELERFLWQREEARRRDHRRLGPELELFGFREEAPGFVFWYPKGATLFRTLQQFSRELQAAQGYEEVMTPPLLRVDLWQRSGHWQHYQQNMYFLERDEEMWAVKPMNCPGHCLLYKSKPRSYRDLPLRLAEYGQLARYERSGVLHGLLRVRGFVQDAAHLFVREDQIGEEIQQVLELIDKVYETFGMPYEIKLSTRPDDFMGDPALWERAEAALAAALEATGRAYRVNPKDGAFYGPKLDFDVTDSLGRRWQCATVQLDFQLPEKFDLTYRGADGRDHRPVMIHRAVMGSLERFIGILTEHYAGAFPTWLAPEQVRVLPIADRHAPYARRVLETLGAAGVRAWLDDRNEKIGYKIRQGQVEKVPYMLIIGDQEVASGSVAVRSRSRGDLGRRPLQAFLDDVLAEIREKRH
ncbi:MAG: threonine--tRNA ligase [Clostridia bacterium]|nr:threonine--tRNA ligase [Clostridia bacterium]